MKEQLDLFAHIAGAYASAPDCTLSNEALYREVSERAGIPLGAINTKVPIGRAAALHSPLKRRLRWFQQSMRAMGVLERVEDARGVWRLSEEAGRNLHRTKPGVKMIGFSTKLGVAIWGSNESVFPDLGEPIHLAITSPPYPLRCARAYGNGSAAEYVDFISRTLETIVKNLAPSGSICLNVANDIFEERSPARSLYKERLVIALCDRFGLSLMDTLIWHNPSKPPGPIQWASKRRVQLNVAWEPIYWFAKDPHLVNADNRRVLQAHSERHLALISRGGEQRQAVFGDGAYRISHGSFANPTEGKIPRNILAYGHQCAEGAAYRRAARELGLPVHAAAFPYRLPEFLIKFLSEVGQLVVDPFAGTFRTALAAERLGRRWVGTEIMLEYIRAAGELFRPAPGFSMSSAFDGIKGAGHPRQTV